MVVNMFGVMVSVNTSQNRNPYDSYSMYGSDLDRPW